MKKALIISCFGWFKERLEPIRSILIENNYDVVIITSDYCHIKKENKKERYKECTYVHVPQYKRNISVQRARSHFYFGKEIARYIEQIQPDFLYAVIPPNNVAYYCRRYKEEHPTIKLIFDIIDLWPESMPLGILKNTSPASVWKKWRDDAITCADHVFTECNLYKEILKDVLNPEKTSTLYLFKEQRDEEKALVERIIGRGKQDNIIRFAYLGSMNNIIDIDGICAVIRQFVECGYQCELHAIGNGESREKFEEAVRKIDCKTQFYGLVFDEIEKIRILAPCDYAFNMMKRDINVGLTIKSIDYLSCGLPLINNIKGDTWKLVDDERVGINVDCNELKLSTFDHNTIVHVFKNFFSKESFIKSVKSILN